MIREIGVLGGLAVAVALVLAGLGAVGDKRRRGVVVVVGQRAAGVHRPGESGDSRRRM